MQLETGTYGAKVQSWRRANPRDVLKALVESNPGADEGALLKMLRDRLEEDDGRDYLDSIVEYWFINNYNSLVPRSPARRINVESVKAGIKKSAVKMVLMDLVMPNGRTLRDCTGGECAAFGGWYERIGAKVEAGQKVGEALSEKELHELLDAA